MQEGGTVRGRSVLAVGPALALTGGSAVLAARFLEMGNMQIGTMARVEIPANHFKGDGVILIAGVILAVIGVLMWVASGSTADTVLGVLAILAGAFGVLVASVMVGKEPIISTAADALHVPEAALKHSIALGQSRATLGPAPWLGLGGSILVLVGGIVNVVAARRASMRASERTKAPPPRQPVVAP